MPIKPENRKLYPPYWPELSYAIRYLRASGLCEWIDSTTGQRCQRRDGEPIPGNPRASKTVLTVAHLDHNPSNCDLSNLRAWCQRHHTTYDAPGHAKNAKATRRRKVEARYASRLL